MPRVQFTEGWESFTSEYWKAKSDAIVDTVRARYFGGAHYDAIYYRNNIKNELETAEFYRAVGETLSSWTRNMFGYWNIPDLNSIENPALALGKLVNLLITYEPNGSAAHHAMLVGLAAGVTIEEHHFTFHEMIDALEIDRVRREMEAECQRRVAEQQRVERYGRELHPTEGYRVHHRRLRKQLEDAGIDVVSREEQEYTRGTVSTSNEGIVYNPNRILSGTETTDEYQKVIDTVTTICTMLFENGYKFTLYRSLSYNDVPSINFGVTGFIDPALHRDVKNCSAEFTEWLEEQVNERVERRQPVTV